MPTLPWDTKLIALSRFDRVKGSGRTDSAMDARALLVERETTRSRGRLGLDAVEAPPATAPAFRVSRLVLEKHYGLCHDVGESLGLLAPPNLVLDAAR